CSHPWCRGRGLPENRPAAGATCCPAAIARSVRIDRDPPARWRAEWSVWPPQSGELNPCRSRPGPAPWPTGCDREGSSESFFQLAGHNVERSQGCDGVREIAALHQVVVSLKDVKAWAAAAQPVRTFASIADEVKT